MCLKTGPFLMVLDVSGSGCLSPLPLTSMRSLLRLLDLVLTSTLMVPPFYSWENWGSERGSSLPKTARLPSGGIRTRTRSTPLPARWRGGVGLTGFP